MQFVFAGELVAVRFIGVSVIAGCLQGQSGLYTVSVIIMQIKFVVVFVVVIKDVFNSTR